jgi:hypothetical protein
MAAFLAEYLLSKGYEKGFCKKQASLVRNELLRQQSLLNLAGLALSASP